MLGAQQKASGRAQYSPVSVLHLRNSSALACDPNMVRSLEDIEVSADDALSNLTLLRTDDKCPEYSSNKT